MNNKSNAIETIKKMNRKMVLDQVKTSDGISRTEIAQELGLSKSTVSAIVEELLGRKLIEESGKGSSTNKGGRRRKLLQFNPKSSLAVGVDVGGTKIQIAMTDLDGEILYEKKFSSQNDVKELIQLIHYSIEESELDSSHIIALGIGVPGWVQVDTGIVIEAPALKWNKRNLKEEMEPHFDYPVFINNDVNCAALGEKWLGSGEESDNLYFIAIGTGVGSAIISGGELVYGHNYQSGEIGYQLSKEDLQRKDLNTEGEFGEFEKKISGEAFRNGDRTAKDVFAEYSGHTNGSSPVVKNFFTELSLVITNSVNLLNPELVVIGGGVSESMHSMIEELNERVASLTPIKTNIKLASLGGAAGAYGAIYHAYTELEEAEEL
ncbi:ROK family transcriptional regulator [Salibacterium qingdaonense]|uniref:Glucokinase n=1 Tax=Salibacterium qingdaonense TaxID=266892 RepID=A0A1I4LMV6_9BACI|nr:ROK family transcriptional regulator [Salibacterium qingdaonense]SFL91927.1 glucokinase [Salibacterium qingdaonense]